MANSGSYLGDLTWPAAEQRLAGNPLVIVPFAAGAKEHGRHLPMNTDERVMRHLLDIVVAQRDDTLIAPPILHGWFPAFRDYPGTEVRDVTIFLSYVREVAESLVRLGAQRLVLMNMGITKATGLPLAIVARDLRSSHGVATLVLSWDDLETQSAAALAQQERGGHADELETSAMLAIDPDRVDMPAAQTDYGSPSKPQIGYAPGHFDRLDDTGAPSTGAFGDPTLATVEKGQQLLALMAENLLLALDQFSSRAPV